MRKIRLYGGPHDSRVMDIPDDIANKGHLVLQRHVHMSWLDNNPIKVPEPAGTVSYIRMMIPTITREGDPEPWHYDGH